MGNSPYDDVMWLNRIVEHKSFRQLIAEDMEMPDFEEEKLRNDDYVYLCEVETFVGPRIQIWYPERSLKLTQMLRHYKEQFEDSDVIIDADHNQESGGNLQEKEEFDIWSDKW